MIGAIVLAKRDVLITDVGTGQEVDQSLIEKSSRELILENSNK